MGNSLTLIINIVIIAVVLYILVSIVKYIIQKRTDNVQYHINQLPQKSTQELKSMASELATALILHDKMISMGNKNADAVTKYEKYGCHNYNEVNQLKKALNKELNKRG